MIKYDRLWQTMKDRGVTQYDLYTHHNVNRSQIDRLRKNQNVEVNTIDKLCNILDCRVEDIMEHFPDDNRFEYPPPLRNGAAVFSSRRARHP